MASTQPNDEIPPIFTFIVGLKKTQFCVCGDVIARISQPLKEKMDAARDKGCSRLNVPGFQAQTFQDFLFFAHIGNVPRCHTVRFCVDEPYDPYLRDYKLDIDLWIFAKGAKVKELRQIAMRHLNDFNTRPFRPEHVKHAIRMLREVYARTKKDTPEETEFRKAVLEIFYAKIDTLGKDDQFLSYISENQRLLRDIMGAVADRGIGPRDKGLMLDIQGDMVSWRVKTRQENNLAEAADGDGQ